MIVPAENGIQLVVGGTCPQRERERYFVVHVFNHVNSTAKGICRGSDMKSCLCIASLIIGEIRTTAHDAYILLTVIDKAAQQQGLVQSDGNIEEGVEPIRTE